MSTGANIISAIKAFGQPFNFQRSGPFGRSPSTIKGVMAQLVSEPSYSPPSQPTDPSVAGRYDLFSAANAIRTNAPWSNVLGILDKAFSEFNPVRSGDQSAILRTQALQIGAHLQAAYNTRRREQVGHVASVAGLVDSLFSAQTPSELEELRDGVGVDAAIYLYSLGFVEDAAKVAGLLETSDSPTSSAFFETQTGLYLRELENGSRTPSVLDRIFAGVARLFHEARIPYGPQRILYPLIGSTAGAVASVLNGGTFEETLPLSMAGGAAAYLVRAGYEGARDERTRQAYETGHSGLSSGALAKNAARLALGAGWTGCVSGFLSSIPLHLLAPEAGALAGEIAKNGIDGVGKFWEYLHTETIPGDSFNKSFVSSGGFYQRAFPDLLARVGTSVWNSLSNPSIVDGLMMAYKIATVGYLGATLLYPSTRKHLGESMGKVDLSFMEICMAPATYIMARDLAILWNVPPGWASWLPFAGAIAQLSVHWGSGGTLASIDGANALRGMLVPLIYSAAGHNMVSHLPHAKTFQGILLNSFSVQLGLLPIGALHMFLQGFRASEFYLNKLGRFVSPVEYFGLILRFASGGFASPVGAFLSELTQKLLSPWTYFSIRREATGSISQASSFLDAKSNERLRRLLKVGGNYWSFSQIFGVGDTPPDLSPESDILYKIISTISYPLAFPVTLVNKLHAPFAQKPNVAFYIHTVHDTLMGKGKIHWTEPNVEELLQKIASITKEQVYSEDMERLVLAIYASQNSGKFGGVIKKWIGENPDLLAYYGIDSSGTKITEGEEKKWLRNEIRMRYKERRPFSDTNRNPTTTHSTIH